MRLMLKKIIFYSIKTYRYCISPLTPPACRFEPTCSEYALIALSRFSLKQACTLITKRILSCTPGGKSGYDPVPNSNPHE